MSAVAWLSRQEIVALGWALLHFCWQGTAVAVAYAVVDRATSHASSKVRYAVALAALMIMPLIVVGTFADEPRVATHTRSPVGSTSDTSFNFAPAAPTTRSTPILHELPLATSLEEQGTDWFNWIAARADRFLPWVVALWLSGVLLLALRALGGWWLSGVMRARTGFPITVQIPEFPKEDAPMYLSTTYPQLTLVFIFISFLLCRLQITHRHCHTLSFSESI